MSCRTCYTADLATFRQMFPKLDSVDDTTVQNNLDSAECALDENTWGCTLPEAQLYFAAHQIASSENIQGSSSVDGNGNVITNPSAGRLASASDGPLSVGYNNNSLQSSDNAFVVDYSSTEYGIHYLSLQRRQMPMGILALTNNTCGGNGFFFG